MNAGCHRNYFEMLSFLTIFFITFNILCLEYFHAVFVFFHFFFDLRFVIKNFKSTARKREQIFTST